MGAPNSASSKKAAMKIAFARTINVHNKDGYSVHITAIVELSRRTARKKTNRRLQATATGSMTAFQLQIDTSAVSAGEADNIASLISRLAVNPGSTDSLVGTFVEYLNDP